MHIPNGLVSDSVCALTTVASSSVLGLGFWRARRGDDHVGAQSLAAVGAVVFAVQMVNFPIDHGTSGHLIGAALAAAVLGPWGAMWAMASVLATQALVFGDGGIAALGANLLTMAVAAPWTAWLAYRGLTYCGLTDSDSAAGSKGAGRTALCWGLASLASVLVAATVCSLVLAWGGATPARLVLPAMLSAHLPVGMVEGVATAAVVLLAAGRIGLPLGSRTPVAVGRISRPAKRLMPVAAGAAIPTRWLLALSAAVAVLLAPWASNSPDGLEMVTARLGFSPLDASGFAGVLPDYALPGVAWAPLAVAMAGLVGVALAAATGYLVGRAAEGAKSR